MKRILCHPQAILRGAIWCAPPGGHSLGRGLPVGPPASGPCWTVRTGAIEIRLHGDKEIRVFYVARFQEAVYVLHAFVKKTRTTCKADIDLVKARYAAMMEARQGQT
ncbi:MAG: type II toxin-antitoxin system RelE/ParE family toxin [Bryobacterales bacterium]|nr:type II toxin-antitoxin system RelE/ParE family toxin [Bryobacterales bacterium]